MTTPTGTISMLDVIKEIDGTSTARQISLNDADVRQLAEKPTGQISLNDLRGKTSNVVFVQDVTKLNRTGSIPAGDGLFVIGRSEQRLLAESEYLRNPSASEMVTDVFASSSGLVSPLKSVGNVGFDVDISSGDINNVTINHIEEVTHTLNNGTQGTSTCHYSYSDLDIRGS